MDTFTFLGMTAGAAVALNVLGAITQDADEYLTKVKASGSPVPPDAKADKPGETSANQNQKTAGYYWRQLLTHAALFGLLLVPVLIGGILINTFIGAGSLEMVLGSSSTLFTFTLWG